MERKSRSKIGIFIAVIIALGLCLVLYSTFDRYEPSEDEIAIRIKFNTKEDVGLLVYDYCVDGQDEYSGGVSNADRSLIAHDSDDIFVVLNRDELNSASEAVQLSMRFRIITEYVDPNFENVYPEDITRYIEAINFEARFGTMYSVTITGDEANGYKAVLSR